MNAVPGFEHKAFIPFTNAYHETPPKSTSVIQAIATAILPDKVILASGEAIPYEYLVMATGTGRLPLELTTKLQSVHSFNLIQDRMKQAKNIVIVGGGAFGIRECY